MFNKLLLASLAIAVVALTVNVFTTDANAQQRNQQRNQQITSGFQYATLRALANDQYQFDQGGSQLPVARSLRALQRELGNSERESVVNLLNAIGAQGWELVMVEEQQVWTFRRRDMGQ